MRNIIDDLLPGDEISVTTTVTVMAVDTAYNSVETDDYDTVSLDGDVTIVRQDRPEHWPAEIHDVWRINGEHFHVLGDGEFYDVDGEETTIADAIAGIGCVATDLTLVFRPGTVIHAKAK